MSVTIRLTVAMGLVALNACSQPSTSAAGNAIPAVRAPESFRDFGDYVVHFNAINTDQLTPEIARQYGIVRSSNRAMLNVSVLRKEAGTTGVPVSGQVVASAVNLTGQLKALELREIREESAIYYIAELAVTNEETLTFTIDVTPTDAPGPLSVRYMKKFYVD